MTLIDKELSASYWYSLTNTWDLAIVMSEESTLQAAQNRILSDIWSWIYDDNFGGLLEELRNTPIQKITESQISGYIAQALTPMMEDNRVLWIISVTILERLPDSIQVEIKLDLDLSIGTLNINIEV